MSLPWALLLLMLQTNINSNNVTSTDFSSAFSTGYQIGQHTRHCVLVLKDASCHPFQTATTLTHTDMAGQTAWDASALYGVRTNTKHASALSSGSGAVRSHLPSPRTRACTLTRPTHECLRRHGRILSSRRNGSVSQGHGC